MRAQVGAQLRSVAEIITIEAERSLALWRIIEETSTVLNYQAAIFRYLSARLDSLLETYRKMTGLLDPDNTIRPILEKARDRLAIQYERTLAARTSAYADYEWADPDGICTAFDDAVNVQADLLNKLTTAYYLIGERDATIEKPAPKKYTDAAAFIRDLKKGV